jgi:hypothetical protein
VVRERPEEEAGFAGRRAEAAGRSIGASSRRPGKPRSSPQTAVAAICAAALVLTVAGYLAYEPVVERLATVSSVKKVESDDKIVGFGQSLTLLRDFPLTGIGRGAFPTVGARYLTFSPQTAEYIEDEPLQAFADFGIPDRPPRVRARRGAAGRRAAEPRRLLARAGRGGFARGRGPGVALPCPGR